MALHDPIIIIITPPPRPGGAKFDFVPGDTIKDDPLAHARALLDAAEAQDCEVQVRD